LELLLIPKEDLGEAVDARVATFGENLTI